MKQVDSQKVYSVARLLKELAKEFDSSGIATPNLDARIILANVIKCSFEDLMRNSENIVTDKHLKDITSKKDDRLKGKSIAKIIGYKYFWEDEFITNEHTLDPRPDTEILIELINKHFKDKNKPIKILELGIGTGCILLTLLKIYLQSQGIGVDISSEAIKVASKNATKLKVNSRVKIIESDLFTNIENQKFDIIVSNPPYIPINDIKNLSPEVQNDPMLALNGGDDGLNFYRRIAENANRFLADEGNVFVEIGQNQEKMVIEIFAKNNFILDDYANDLNNIVRSLAFKLKN